MKPLVPQEERGRTISGLIVVCTGILFAVLLLNLGKVRHFLGTLLNAVMPFIIGICIAILLLPIVKRVEWFFTKVVFRRKAHPKLSRTLAVVVAYIVMLAAVTGFISIVAPQLVASISSILQYISGFDIARFAAKTSRGVSQWLAGIHLLGADGTQLSAAWDEAVSGFIADLSRNGSSFVNISSGMLSSLLNYSSGVLNGIMTVSGNIYTTFLQIFIGLISAFYLLIDKETFCAQIKKVLYAVLKPATCDKLIYWTRRGHRIFAGFVTGKLLDSFIIGVICYLCMLLFGIEYPLLISVIVGITNIVPFFGPYFGAIPSILILLLVNPLSALWFLIFILILQQIDGNVIGPFILGDYVGLPPFWIMLAIIVGGKLFGFIGLLLSIPVFALFYAIVRALVETQLAKREMPRNTEDFIDIPEVIPEEKPRKRIRKK